MNRSKENIRLQQMRKSWHLYLGPFSIFLATAFLLYGRLNIGGKNLFQESLWGEDGLFPLCNIKSPDLLCGVDSYSGYWSGLPRLVAWVVSQFPMHDWALINNTITLFLLSCAAAFSYTCIVGYFKNIYIAGFIVLAPSLLAVLRYEVLMVTNSIFEVLGFYILLIFLYGSLASEDFPWQRLIFNIVIFAYVVSNPLGTVLCALFWFDYIIFFRKSRHKLNTTIVASVGSLIQALFVLLSHSDRDLGVGFQQFFEYFLIEIVKSFSLIFYVPDNSNYFSESNLIVELIAILIIIAAFFVVIIYFKTFHKNFSLGVSNRFVIYPLFALTSSLVISLFTRGVGVRFEVMATLYATLILIGFLEVQQGLIRKIGYLALVLAYVVNGVLNFSAGDFRSSGPLWSQELQQSRDYCLRHPASSVAIVFAPNWIASISHPYKVSEPTTENLKCTDLIKKD